MYSPRSNSVIISTWRSQPTSLHAASEYTSPSDSTGWRVFARTMAIRVSLSTPRSASLSIGM